MNEYYSFQFLEAHKSAILTTLRRKLCEGLSKYQLFKNLQQNILRNSPFLGNYNPPFISNEGFVDSPQIRGEYLAQGLKHETAQLFALFDQFAGVLCGDFASPEQEPSIAMKDEVKCKYEIVKKEEYASQECYSNETPFETSSVSCIIKEEETLKTNLKQEMQSISLEEGSIEERRESPAPKSVPKVDKMKHQGFKPKSGSNKKGARNYRSSQSKLRNKLLEDPSFFAKQIEKIRTPHFNLKAALRKHIQTNPLRKPSQRRYHKNQDLVEEFLRQRNLLKPFTNSETQSDS